MNHRKNFRQGAKRSGANAGQTVFSLWPVIRCKYEVNPTIKPVHYKKFRKGKGKLTDDQVRAIRAAWAISGSMTLVSFSAVWAKECNCSALVIRNVVNCLNYQGVT